MCGVCLFVVVVARVYCIDVCLCDSCVCVSHNDVNVVIVVVGCDVVAAVCWDSRCSSLSCSVYACC